MSGNRATLTVHNVKELTVNIEDDSFEEMKRVLFPEMAKKIDLLQAEVDLLRSFVKPNTFEYGATILCMGKPLSYWYELQDKLDKAVHVLRIYANKNNWRKTPIHSEWILNPNGGLLAEGVLEDIKHD